MASHSLFPPGPQLPALPLRNGSDQPWRGKWAGLITFSEDHELFRVGIGSLLSANEAVTIVGEAKDRIQTIDLVNPRTAMERNPIFGTWRLVSLEMRNLDGQVSYPLGPDAVGYLIYTKDGYMSVVMMSANQTEFASDDIRQATIEEKVASWDTSFSMCGRYEIRDNKIITHILVGFFPNWVGEELVRSFELDGNRLLLSTPPFLVDGQQQSSRSIYERV